MSVIERFRKLLDERGVEHYDYIAEVWWGGESSGGGGAKYTAYEQTDGLICVEIADLTPEQALAATLGPGTCKPITYDNGYSIDHLEPGEYHEFWEPACACGNCGELIPMRKFCPNCGSRLEVDDG